VTRLQFPTIIAQRRHEFNASIYRYFQQNKRKCGESVNKASLSPVVLNDSENKPKQLNPMKTQRPSVPPL
jgi:hypothetical protein